MKTITVTLTVAERDALVADLNMEHARLGEKPMSAAAMNRFVDLLHSAEEKLRAVRPVKKPKPWPWERR